jgi:glycosyltransferase involved in cell wall biosynthesis
LKIIGTGPEQEVLKALAEKLNVQSQIVWLFKSGVELKQELASSGICIIPSAWEEPGAVTVMNLMADGKPLIVSEQGWLTEFAGDACLTFPNRNRNALAEAMDKLRFDRHLQSELIRRGFKRLKEYRPEQSIDAYVSLFQELIQLS